MLGPGSSGTLTAVARPLFLSHTMAGPQDRGSEPSLRSVVHEFDRRLRTLKTLVLLRTSDQDADAADVLAMLDAHLRGVEEDVREVKRVLAEERAAIEETRALGQAAHAQAKRVRAMQARLPAHLPGDARISAERAAAAHTQEAVGMAPRRPATAAASSAAVEAGAAQIAPTAREPLSESAAAANESAPGPSVGVKARKAAPAVPNMQYLTTDELNSAPAYMRNRLTIDKVNSAVDEVQDIFGRKYEILRMPHRQLSTEQKKLQAGYKQLEMDHPKLKGLLFISETDCKTARLVKSDQTGKNIMSVLRHVQRLKEISVGGLKCWFMVG
mmetsp:Transcript_1265/g.3535  ORF Transcript_1265/g.3535 Transcript_1265/m.3535 type:complete len:328 (+) Transcript_1265:979-1962(+)